jgi:hypothetical protein
MNSKEILQAIRDLDPEPDPDALSSREQAIADMLLHNGVIPDSCEDCITLEKHLRRLERRNADLRWALLVSMLASALAIAWGVSRA